MPVYFIQAGDDGPIKIGFSTDVHRRLANMQTASVLVLRLLAVVEGDAAEEAAIHERLAPSRIRGEWFADTLDLRAEIAAGQPVPPPPSREARSKLDGFMLRRGLIDAEMAQALGCDRSRITKIRNGKDLPSLRLAVQIERFTDGEVRVMDFAPPDDLRAAS